MTLKNIIHKLENKWVAIIICLLALIIFYNWNWWLFFSVLIALFIIDLGIGIIFLIAKLQKKLIPELNDGHSGNSWGFSKYLAALYFKNLDNSIIEEYSKLVLKEFNDD